MLPVAENKPSESIAYKITYKNKTIYIVGTLHDYCNKGQSAILNDTFTSFLDKINPNKVYFELRPSIFRPLYKWDDKKEHQGGSEYYLYTAAQKKGSVFRGMESLYYHRAMLNNTSVPVFRYRLTSPFYKKLFQRAPLTMSFVNKVCSFLVSYVLARIHLLLCLLNLFMFLRMNNVQEDRKQYLVTEEYAENFKFYQYSQKYYNYMDQLTSLNVRNEYWVEHFIRKELNGERVPIEPLSFFEKSIRSLGSVVDTWALFGYVDPTEEEIRDPDEEINDPDQEDSQDAHTAGLPTVRPVLFCAGAAHLRSPCKNGVIDLLEAMQDYEVEAIDLKSYRPKSS
jgi:hypothetical protein